MTVICGEQWLKTGSPFSESQNNFVKCQNCKHLTKEGLCSALDRVRPMVNALRHCDAFLALGYSKPLIDERPLDIEELNDAYSRVAKPFFYHLRDCKACDLDKESFCAVGKELHLDRESVLMCFENAEEKNKAFIAHLKKILEKPEGKNK